MNPSENIDTVGLDGNFQTILDNMTKLLDQASAMENTTEYFYDYDESRNYLPLDEVVPVSIFYGLTLLLGVVGNTLVIYSVARFRRMRNVTNLFLLSLASADLMLVLICVPIKGISFFSYTWRLGEFLCRFVHFMQNVSMICSVMTLTVMSIERFVAVYYPLRARTVCTVRHARAVIIIVWVMSFIMALPIIFGQKRRTVGLRRAAYWCQKIWSHREYSILYELYMLIVIFIIPVAVMVVTYSLISIEIWNVVTKRADMRSGIVIGTSDGSHSQIHDFSQTSLSVEVHTGINSRKCLQSKVLTHKEDDRTKRQVILMLVTIVVLFIICWGPILINNVLVAFEMVNLLSEGHLKPIRIAFSLMAYANSCVNPIVYGFMSKNFRKSFQHALCFCWSKRKRLQNINRSATFTTKASMIDSTGKADKRLYGNSNGCYRSNVLEKPLLKGRHRKESDEMMELNVIME